MDIDRSGLFETRLKAIDESVYKTFKKYETQVYGLLTESAQIINNLSGIHTSIL